jgi:hypothetical protein
MLLKVIVPGPECPVLQYEVACASEDASPLSGREIPKALINSDELRQWRCIMRNHDLVSNGFLALTTASLVLLCSGLLAFAFG